MNEAQIAKLNKLLARGQPVFYREPNNWSLHSIVGINTDWVEHKGGPAEPVLVLKNSGPAALFNIDASDIVSIQQPLADGPAKLAYVVQAEHYAQPGIITHVFENRDDAVADAVSLLNMLLKDANEYLDCPRVATKENWEGIAAKLSAFYEDEMDSVTYVLILDRPLQ